MSARRLAALSAAVLAAAGCEKRTPYPGEGGLAGFLVTVDPAAGGVQGADLVCTTATGACLDFQFSGFEGRSIAGQGTERVPYAFPSSGAVAFYVRVQAVDAAGAPFAAFDRPLSFRVAPGKVIRMFQPSGEPSPVEGMLRPAAGGQAEGYVVARSLYGVVRIWAEDRDAVADYVIPPSDDPFSTSGPTPGPAYATIGGRTYLGGVTDPIWFETPDLADVQRISFADIQRLTQPNRTSPLIGNYLTVAKGEMVVTNVSPDGFYATDVAAQKLSQAPFDAYPGHFAHIFVYNYNYPDDLYIGDRLISLTGTVQEFSSDTQISWPSWLRRERPTDFFTAEGRTRYRPGPVATLDRTICASNPVAPLAIDRLCGYSNKNMKIESLESALVALKSAAVSTAFAENCDKNGNGQVSFFFATGSPGPTLDCTTENWCCDRANAEFAECLCYRDCVTGSGPYSAAVCSEGTTLRNYGQWIVVVDARAEIRINVQTRDALPNFDARIFAARCATADDAAACPCGPGSLRYAAANLCTAADEQADPRCKAGTCKPQSPQSSLALDIVGNLRQVQAARPRWMVVARDALDVCCHQPAVGQCPPGLSICPTGRQ